MENKCCFCGGHLIKEKSNYRCENCGRTISNDTSDEKINEINAIKRRIEIYLEDKEWKNVEQYSNKLLDIDPENGWGYLYLLLAKNKYSEINDLLEIRKNSACIPLLRNAIRFADEDLKEKIGEICGELLNRFEEEDMEERYKEAKKMMNFATCPEDYQRANSMFNSIQSYWDSAELANLCLIQANDMGNESYNDIYNTCLNLMNKEYNGDVIYNVAKKLARHHWMDSAQAEKIVKEYLRTCDYNEAYALLFTLPVTYKDVEFKKNQIDTYIAEHNFDEKYFEEIKNYLKDNNDGEVHDKVVHKPLVFKLIPFLAILLLIIAFAVGGLFASQTAKINLVSTSYNKSKNTLIITYDIENKYFTGNIESIKFKATIYSKNGEKLGTITTTITNCNIGKNQHERIDTTMDYNSNDSFDVMLYGLNVNNVTITYEIISINIK